MNREQLAAEIQKVINTLEMLDIKPTYDNMNKLLGSMQVLVVVRDELKKQEVKADGNADTE